MAKFLVLWRFNLNVPWPTDPTQMTQLAETLFAAIDHNLKSGKVQEFGYFLDGKSGYAIGSGEVNDQFGRLFSFYPWIIGDAHEMIPYETGKEITRGIIKARL